MWLQSTIVFSFSIIGPLCALENRWYVIVATACMVVVFTFISIQSVPITIKVGNYIPALGKVYSMQIYVIKLVRDLR
jgi:hypothetical protein